MEPARIQWNPDKLADLASQLDGFWAKDEWYFRDCPLIPEGFVFKEKLPLNQPLRFSCVSPLLNVELKYACWQKLNRRDWQPQAFWSKKQDINCLIEWLNLAAPQTTSFLERSLESWLLSYRSYLTEKGIATQYKSNQRLRLGHEIRQYDQDSPKVIVLRQIYKTLCEAYDNRPEYDREVWDVRRMGIPHDLAKSEYRLSFHDIDQPWLLHAAKQFVRYSLAVCSIGECQSRLSLLRDFSAFITHCQPHLAPDEIDRAIVREFILEFAFTGLSEGTRQRQIGGLRTFLELCAREGWAPIPDRRMIYSEDIPQSKRPLPRFVPEEVMMQLNQHLEELPPSMMRMVLIIQEAGMRIGELCKISFDCLSQDAQGDWFLRYYQPKLKKEHTIPISQEVVGVIREQQQITRQDWGDKFPYLFANKRGLPIKQKVFAEALNRLVLAKDIRSAAGNLWDFQSHQFRHTVGTRMINNSVPHHIVQRFLGHSSPEMTNRYAYIHDQTLKTEFAKFKGKMVDITGKVVQPEEIVAEIAEGTGLDNLDDQWLKKHVLTQALPNGICGLPAVQKACPYGANKCYSCTHFKTDAQYLTQHKEHLDRTEKIIAWAEEHPESSRAKDLLKENRPVSDGLRRIITALEGKTA